MEAKDKIQLIARLKEKRKCLNNQIAICIANLHETEQFIRTLEKPTHRTILNKRLDQRIDEI